MELPSEDQPPQRIWLDDEALADHFERLREKWSGGRTSTDEEVAPMSQNELTRGLR